MPRNLNIPSPSELIKGTDIVSTFQNLYNILFAILLALAFLSFVYGAFQYLLSGASIFNQQEGKNRMKNSLIALIVVLIIPPILNLINPKIFQGVKMPIPKLTFNMPSVTSINPKVPGGVPGAETDINIDLKSLNIDKKDVICKFPDLSNPSNLCSVQNLFKTIFPNSSFRGNDNPVKDMYNEPWSRDEAIKLVKRLSLICINESHGIPTVESKTDRCLDNQPFSFGLFQINIFHTDISACNPGKIFAPGSSDKPLKEKYNCKLQTNKESRAMYEVCKSILKKPTANITAAFKKVDKRNPDGSLNKWRFWRIIQDNCGDPASLAI
ncbi:MAG: hypothetical protein KatS3mg093_186 [Candidatus Parcubacteria bacterium]|nr:MAG: hypothetical protein KatS3mg093_186 [Candidatus Parcubacteria bacterium]